MATVTVVRTMRTPIPPKALAERCRRGGLKATPQRLAVYGALLEADDHPSAEALFWTVREKLPSISLATVYKTLESLEAAGLIRQVSLLSDSKRYDANQHHHHHLVCRVCKRIIDYDDPRLDALLPNAEPSGFTPLEVRVQIVGVCARCQGAADAQAPETSS